MKHKKVFKNFSYTLIDQLQQSGAIREINNDKRITISRVQKVLIGITLMGAKSVLTGLRPDCCENLY